MTNPTTMPNPTTLPTSAEVTAISLRAIDAAEASATGSAESVSLWEVAGLLLDASSHLLDAEARAERAERRSRPKGQMFRRA